jgi:hypothetical protein
VIMNQRFKVQGAVTGRLDAFMPMGYPAALNALRAGRVARIWRNAWPAGCYLALGSEKLAPGLFPRAEVPVLFIRPRAVPVEIDADAPQGPPESSAARQHRFGYFGPRGWIAREFPLAPPLPGLDLESWNGRDWRIN